MAQQQQQQDAASSHTQPVVHLKSPYARKQDVFDAPDFDPVKFINTIYPDGEAAVAGPAQRSAQHARTQTETSAPRNTLPCTLPLC
jgi:hypothetical protein